MKESTRKEFDRIKAEATRLFGTSDLTFKEYPTASGWRLEIRLCIMAGNRVFDLIHGESQVCNDGGWNHYGNRYPSSVEDMFTMMNADYQRILSEYKIYMMEETIKALNVLG